MSPASVSMLGPDVVIAGAARSGTSSLAAQLGAHPQIDPGKVKEPNYFSRGLDKGPEWYDRLYQPRQSGLHRLDGSVSYTSPLYPQALDRLVEVAPDAIAVYLVRHPTQRALSHYLFRHHHLRIENASTFGAALRSTSYYEDGSDYSTWLPRLRAAFGEEHLLVVPFELVADNPRAVTTEICRLIGLAPPSLQAEERGVRHRNDVVAYRSDVARRAASLLRHSSLYPRLRSALGAGRVRKARGLLTRQARLPSTSEAMATCAPDQLETLRRLDERAGSAVLGQLRAQDVRLELSWAQASFASSMARD